MNGLSQIERAEHRDQLLDEVVSGLRSSPKRLPCKLFYDSRGSELFDEICELDEYYLTRSELAIMEQFAEQMGAQIGEGVRLVEYGSGSSMKTRLLLEHLPSPVAYVPVDISHDYLLDVSQQLQDDFPAIEVLPVVADFTKPFSIPDPVETPSHTAVYFPGSTIGNFEESAVKSLLKGIAKLCGKGGGLLIGVDLEKDKEVLELAYDDSEGVTSEFNMNLLHRMRQELGAEVDFDGFEHHSFYNEDEARIEIYLRSLEDQTVAIDEQDFKFNKGELIHTEYSHKYTIDRFSEIASTAGFELHQSWTDENDYFAILHLVVADHSC